MNDINHSFFKEKLFEFTGKIFDVVSTIDHPYASPPIRLIDCHNNLKKINDVGIKPLILIWDVNFPNLNCYKYELILDVGILGNIDKDFLIFSDKLIYPLQKPKLLDFPEFEKRIQLILERLQNSPEKTSVIRNQQFIKNFKKLEILYEGVIKISKNGTDFYKNLLKEFYNLLGFSELSLFFENSSQSYFGSEIIKKWIPYCIQETKNEPYGFLNLLDTGLFKKPYFRRSSIFNENDSFKPDYVKKNIDKILALMSNNDMIPSYEIFFWTLFLADIKHFGNDYGFFNRLNNISLQNHFNYNNNKIQLTEHNQDCQNIIIFEKDRSFNCFLERDKYIIKKNNPIKNSRISSLPAIYCHLGDELGGIIKNIFENKIKCPLIIKMGESNTTKNETKY